MAFRLDLEENRQKVLPYCRLKPGEIWTDSVFGHKVGVLDATSPKDIRRLFGTKKSSIMIHDPPYNVVVGNKNTKGLSKYNLAHYVKFSKQWVSNAEKYLDDNSSLYIWLGADQKEGFQPLPDFMIMMRNFNNLKSRSFITMRNQRGYGTQKNWMSVRQELLYYIKGNPEFNVNYTDIPKILKGYYKKVGGVITDNIQRGKSDNIRPGNVWVDIQQVFYRMEENVPGCYAQKPLKCIERIISSTKNDGKVIADFFAHAGTTLIASEIHNRKCFTIDIDPVFAEVTIRRLENFRKNKKTGFQFDNPFFEIDNE